MRIKCDKVLGEFDVFMIMKQLLQERKIWRGFSAQHVMIKRGVRRTKKVWERRKKQVAQACARQKF
jgi:hypothetical protein